MTNSVVNVHDAKTHLSKLLTRVEAGEVIEVARRSLVGRRFIDLYGPLGAGVQTVPQDQFKGVEPGAVDLVGDSTASRVFSDKRTFLTIPLIYKDFLLHWRDIEAARSHNMPLDVSAAAGASRSWSRWPRSWPWCCSARSSPAC